MMEPEPSLSERWIFLGDSLTEGVGARRINYVSELASLLRQRHGARAIHEVRLRQVDPDSFNRFVRVNLAGFLNLDERLSSPSLWLCNLACEGTTIETDAHWLPMIELLQPSLVFVQRGALESVIRPAMVRKQSWPWWIPDTWQGYAALDPRCYFSSTPWRRLKQMLEDHVKQRLRLHLLSAAAGAPLLDQDRLVQSYRALIASLQRLGARVIILGLLPIAKERFPGSSEAFAELNLALDQLGQETGAEFFDWGEALKARSDLAQLFYRDGFHPNLTGAQTLAQILFQRLYPTLENGMPNTMSTRIRHARGSGHPG